MRGEYYRADLLAEAGLPVDRPIRVSSLPGEQILIYRRRSDPRFSDLLRGLDLAPDAAAMARALEAEGVLNDRLLAVAQESLHPITPTQSQAEPIHRLFHERLVEPGSRAYPGGRLSGFYVGKDFELPGLTLPWEVLAHAPLVIDGMAYDRTLAQLFDEAHARLAPERLADAGGITAHGDAHNANVWYERGAEADRLVFFDPAFAGSHVPSLLAEVKSTFHNILAHPLWLYDPEGGGAALAGHGAASGGRAASGQRLAARRAARGASRGEGPAVLAPVARPSGGEGPAAARLGRGGAARALPLPDAGHEPARGAGRRAAHARLPRRWG